MSDEIVFNMGDEIAKALISLIKNHAYFKTILLDTKKSATVPVVYEQPLTTVNIPKFPAVSVYYFNEINPDESKGFEQSFSEDFYIDVAAQNSNWSQLNKDCRKMVDTVRNILRQNPNLNMDCDVERVEFKSVVMGQNSGEVGATLVLVNTINIQVFYEEGFYPDAY